MFHADSEQVKGLLRVNNEIRITSGSFSSFFANTVTFFFSFWRWKDFDYVIEQPVFCQKEFVWGGKHALFWFGGVIRINFLSKLERFLHTEYNC